MDIMIKIDYKMIMRDFVWFGRMIDDYPIAQAGPIWFRLTDKWYRYRIVRVREIGLPNWREPRRMF